MKLTQLQISPFVGRLVCLVLLLTHCVSERIAAQSLPGWRLIWSDEFSLSNGSLPDSAKWSYDLGGGGWGNNELQYYTNRSENARIEDGSLVIEARAESFGGRSYTSARLLTKGKWDWTYGRFEARAKVPQGQGLWPAFWMLGADIDTVGWPNCGEIDVMEHVGRLPKTVFGTIHGPGYSGGDSIGGSLPFFDDVADDYHLFAVEWDVNVIRWYVDDILYFTATPASLGTRDWVFDHDHFLILNVAVGGNFGGPLGSATTFPQELLIDYVRVYEREQEVGINLLGNPGFELGSLASWTGYSPPGGANVTGGYVESTRATYYNGGSPGGANVLTRSGSHAGKVFGDFNGEVNYNGIYQELVAAPSSVWQAEGWVLTHPQDLFSGSNQSWLEVSFRSADDTVLTLHRSQVLTPDSVAVGSWINLEVSEQIDPATFVSLGSSSFLVAPPNTAVIRYQVVYEQMHYGAGSLYFDDLSLARQEVVVGSALPEIVVLGQSETQIELSFQTLPGIHYQMFVSTTLQEESWTLFGSFVGDGDEKLFSYPLSELRQFFRIETAP